MYTRSHTMSVSLHLTEDSAGHTRNQMSCPHLELMLSPSSKTKCPSLSAPRSGGDGLLGTMKDDSRVGGGTPGLATARFCRLSGGSCGCCCNSAISLGETHGFGQLPWGTSLEPCRTAACWQLLLQLHGTMPATNRLCCPGYTLIGGW